MGNARPWGDRPGAGRLAHYPPMGETAANRMTGRTATSSAAGAPVRGDGDPGGRRTRPRDPRLTFAGVRDGLRFPGRPRLWIEVVLIAVSYWVYSMIRNAVPEQAASAIRHADQIWRIERTLGIAVEKAVNHGIDSVTWLIVAMNYYYATLHFVVTIGVLVWLFRRHPGRYSAARRVLFATTALALLGYYCYPLAPPRLMDGVDFVDTVVLHNTWGSMASGDLANVSNQYAAMPSMHIGWSLWCGITIAVLARRMWVRVLGVVYPGVTLMVIVATANHFWLDAVGGVACLAVGFAVAYGVHGRWPYRFPRLPLAGAPWTGAERSSGNHAERRPREGTGPVDEARAQDTAVGPGPAPDGKVPTAAR